MHVHNGVRYRLEDAVRLGLVPDPGNPGRHAEPQPDDAVLSTSTAQGKRPVVNKARRPDTEATSGSGATSTG